MLRSKPPNVVEQERKLRVHRLLDPQRPVIIEQRDAIRHAHIVRASFGCSALYEIGDRALGRTIIPRGKGVRSSCGVVASGRHAPYRKPGKISSDILRMIS